MEAQVATIAKNERSITYTGSNSILVSHQDMDGLMVIVLAKYFHLLFDKVVSYDYGFEEEQSIVEDLFNYDTIVVADLSLTPALHDKLLSEGKTVLVYDHHETSQWIAEKPGCVWDGQRSGTKIFFDEYVQPRVGRYKPVVAELVNFVDVYDRWVLESPHRATSEDLQRVFVRMGSWDIEDALIRHDRFITAMIKKLKEETHFKWNAVDKMHIQKAKDSEDKAYQEALAMLQIRTDNKGRKFAVASLWGKISMVCHRMLNIEKMEVEYIVIIQRFQNKWGKISFRSREGEFNLIELAGVSGHKASAGAELTPEEAKAFLANNWCFRYKDEVKDGDPVIEVCKDNIL